MTNRLNFSYALLLGSALLITPACSGVDDDDPNCEDGNCDVGPENAACRGRVSDASGTGRDGASILTNNDQFAKFVLLEGEDCPTQASDVMAKLNSITACGPEANGTMVVNEKSSHDALRDDPPADLLSLAQSANRTVVSRQCAVVEEPTDEPDVETKACIGADVSEFDFVMDACSDSTNTPKCFNDESGTSFFQRQECVACLQRDDGKLHKDDLRSGERRCVDREADNPDSGGNDRPEPFTLLFSTFSSKDTLSQGGLEVMAFDESEGVFNYYKEGSGGWNFMGNSKDFQEGQGGFCKGCHPSGGLVQKELPSPWFNWEIAGDVPHADELIDNNKEFFGSAFPLGGEGLELDIVRPGNSQMNDKRVARLSARFDAAKAETSSDRASFADEGSAVFSSEQMHEMLKPLFCTEQITFATGTFGGDGLFKHDLLNTNDFISVPGGEYDAVIEELGQVRGSGRLTSKDSSSQLARPANADVFDGFQEGLYRKMVQANLLSDELIQDIHIIDFTRPLFSDARCELLEFAPEITVADAKAAENMAEAVANGFIKNLEAAGSRSASAEEFLANLKDADGNEARSAKFKVFADKCNERGEADAKAFMTDVVKMAEKMRRETEGRLEIIEGFLRDDVWPSIPSMDDNFERWNPDTCELE